MFFGIMLAELSTEDQNFVLQIYEKYGKFMFKKAYEILQDEHDAADAVQDAMLKIIKFIDKFHGDDNNEIHNKVVICIRGIIEHKAIYHYNEKKKRYAHENGMCFAFEDDEEAQIREIEDSSADIEHLIITLETQEKVQRALCRMSHDLQDAVNLVYFSGYSQAEAAEFLGINAGTLRKRIYTARKQLAKLLEGEYDERNEE